MRYLLLLAMMLTGIANAGWQENLDKMFEDQDNRRDALRTFYLESFVDGNSTVETATSINDGFAGCYSLFDQIADSSDNARTLRDILDVHHDAFVWAQSEHHGVSLLDLRTEVLVMPRIRYKRLFEKGVDPTLMDGIIKSCGVTIQGLNSIDDQLLGLPE